MSINEYHTMSLACDCPCHATHGQPMSEMFTGKDRDECSHKAFIKGWRVAPESGAHICPQCAREMLADTHVSSFLLKLRS